MTSSSVRVGIYGSGRTATELVAALRDTPYRITTSVVHAPERAGADLGELTGGPALGVRATADLEGAIRSGDVDLLLYAGLSGAGHEQAMALCADQGVDMVHACFVHPEVALDAEARRQLSERAAASGARIVGTGMIPGLWLDVLPALLTSALPGPVSVRAERTSDISSWGIDVLRGELGVGTRQTGTAVHVEALLRESARMVADALALSPAAAESRGGLVSATADRTVGAIDVREGEVEGFRQEVVVQAHGVERVHLTWNGLAGAGADHDVELRLTGGDGTELTVRASVPLDPYPGTAARMVRAVGGVQALPPGLHPTSALAVA